MAFKRFYMSYKLKSDRDATESMINAGIDPDQIYGAFVDGPTTMTNEQAVAQLLEDPDYYEVCVEDSAEFDLSEPLEEEVKVSHI